MKTFSGISKTAKTSTNFVFEAFRMQLKHSSRKFWKLLQENKHSEFAENDRCDSKKGKMFVRSTLFEEYGTSISLQSCQYLPGSTLHGYLSKILARSCQDLGKILAKIVTRYSQELQDAMVRS